MLVNLNRKSVLALYLTVIKPFFVVSQATMSTGSADADKYSVAYVTVPSLEVGKTIGHGLVKNKLAACVNIIPQVTSIYEWKNEINEDSELLLMIKTRTSIVDKVIEFVRSNHPYEVCEVIHISPDQEWQPAILEVDRRHSTRKRCKELNFLVLRKR